MEALRVGRNDACPCGSGRKFKVCCLGRQNADPVFRPPPIERPRAVFGDGASTRPNAQPQLHRLNGSDQPIKRIPIHYTYPEPFGTAECVFCFPVQQPLILTSGNVIPAEWLQAGMQFRMQDGETGTVTAVEPPKVWEPPSRVTDQYGRYQRRVLGTIKHKGLVVIDITFGGQTVTGTPDHDWYSVSRKAWVPAQSLRPGELLLNGQGSVVTVEAVSEPRYGFIELYNLEVEELHTYFVGSSEHGSALVHNGKGDYIKKPAVPTEADHVKGVKAPGKYDATVGSEAEARRIVQQALPHAQELPPAVAGQPYPSPPKGVKAWFQVQPAEPDVGNMLPHIKYADWTGGKKGSGGTWGHLFFPPAQ